MKKRSLVGWLVFLALLVVAAIGGLGWPRRDRSPVSASPAASRRAAGEMGVRRPPGRVPASPDRNWLAAARAAMTEPRQDGCGPYRLVSDAGAPDLRRICERIGSRLEAVYRERFGLQPVAEPVGVVLLFAEIGDYRRFASEVAGLPAGYAGFSRAARGVVALHAELAPRAFSTTLAHELTHLVNRRALGSDLPPWLSEGLSDAIGDAADETGLLQLVGLAGVEPQAARLAAAYLRGEARSLELLASLGRDEFDRGGVTFDYEQSALLVRLLLTEEDLADRFLAYLGELAAGEPYAADSLPAALGTSWTALEARLERWLPRP